MLSPFGRCSGRLAFFKGGVLAGSSHHCGALPSHGLTVPPGLLNAADEVIE
jgi:hypothetical protein